MNMQARACCPSPLTSFHWQGASATCKRLYRQLRVLATSQSTGTTNCIAGRHRNVLVCVQAAVELELQDVQPLIDKAKKAVGALTSANLHEVRFCSAHWQHAVYSIAQWFVAERRMSCQSN